MSQGFCDQPCCDARATFSVTADESHRQSCDLHLPSMIRYKNPVVVKDIPLLLNNPDDKLSSADEELSLDSNGVS